MKFANALSVLYEDLMHDVDNRSTEAKALRTQLVRAMDVAAERLRILRGRPMPGALRPTSMPVRRSRRKVDDADDELGAADQSVKPPVASSSASSGSSSAAPSDSSTGGPHA